MTRHWQLSVGGLLLGAGLVAGADRGLDTYALAPPSRQAPIVAWSEPRVAWESSGRAHLPILVTDAWGKVHLFFLGQDEGEASNTLYHMDPNDADSRPVDVLLGLSEYRVTADVYGRLHVFGLGANNAMIYASVDAAEAGNAGAWSNATSLGTGSLGVDIRSDSAGGLHICFPRDHSVGYQRSSDGGASWSEPVRVADMVDPAGVATYVRCVVDSTGVVHVAWAEARPPNYYPPDGVFYARSGGEEGSWSAPEQIAGAQYTLPALLADPEGVVHLLWHGAVGVGGRFYRQRPAGVDGSWGSVETVVPAGNGGMSGDAFLALDSRNTLHVGMNVDGIFWASRATDWSEPVGLTAALRELPNASGSIEQATLAVAHGNEIHLAWEFDFKRIYVITGQTDAPEAAGTPWPVVPADGLGDAKAGPRIETDRVRPVADAEPTAVEGRETGTLSPEALEAGGADDRGHLPMTLGLAFSMIVVGWAVLRRWLEVRR